MSGEKVSSKPSKSISEGESPPTRPRLWRGRLLWVAGVAILAAGATVYAVPVLDRLEEQRTEISDYTAELDVLVAQNTDLRERLDALNTPIEIERLARERLGYVREGETAFVVVAPRASSPGTSEEEMVVIETVEEDAWYGRWWSYITGSDLAFES